MPPKKSSLKTAGINQSVNQKQKISNLELTLHEQVKKIDALHHSINRKRVQINHLTKRKIDIGKDISARINIA